MLKLRRNINPTLQGAPPSCESPRILPLAPCVPPGDVPPTRIPRTARDGAQSVKPRELSSEKNVFKKKEAVADVIAPTISLGKFAVVVLSWCTWPCIPAQRHCGPIRASTRSLSRFWRRSIRTRGGQHEPPHQAQRLRDPVQDPRGPWTPGSGDDVEHGFWLTTFSRDILLCFAAASVEPLREAGCGHCIRRVDGGSEPRGSGESMLARGSATRVADLKQEGNLVSTGKMRSRALHSPSARTRTPQISASSTCALACCSTWQRKASVFLTRSRCFFLANVSCSA